MPATGHISRRRAGTGRRGRTRSAGPAIGNVIWFLVAGLWLALVQIVIGIVLCLTVIGIPFGIACFKMAGLALFPLGKEIVDADHPDAAVSGVHALTPVGR